MGKQGVERVKPIEFAQQDVILAKDQPQYQPLPVHLSADGVVTSCWQSGFRERLLLLCTGRIYVSQLTFGRALQPQYLSLQPPAS